MTIDLRSDTVTRPTAPMRQAIAVADVGDDHLDGDPTTRRLEARVAALSAKRRAVFSVRDHGEPRGDHDARRPGSGFWSMPTRTS